jgi:hypothetical protein
MLFVIVFAKRERKRKKERERVKEIKKKNRNIDDWQREERGTKKEIKRERKTNTQRHKEKREREISKLLNRNAYLNKKFFSGQNAETSLMIGTNISVEETLPISEEVFTHLFNDHATGIFVGTGSDRLQTGNGSFIVDVKDSLWKKIETFLIIASF